ncbi:MAG: Eco29kI family restriction endonuclease [Hyphomonadaceae bacterium]
MTSKQDHAAQLREALDKITSDAAKATLTNPARKKLEQEIVEGIDRLTELLNRIDPIQQPASIFDPSDPQLVGRFVALALVAQPRVPMPDLGRFYGSGVYAIYYRGPFEPYAPISGTETPVYVGKVGPVMGGARTAREQGPKLIGRLMEHRRNITKAKETLDVADFDCRALVVTTGWEIPAEDYLIQLFKPIWNKETGPVLGIGKHGDAAETRGNTKSPWDTMHEARAWATTGDRKSREEIEAALVEHFKNVPTFLTSEDVLKSFVAGLRQA